MAHAPQYQAPGAGRRRRPARRDRGLRIRTGVIGAGQIARGTARPLAPLGCRRRSASSNFTANWASPWECQACTIGDSRASVAAPRGKTSDRVGARLRLASLGTWRLAPGQVGGQPASCLISGEGPAGRVPPRGARWGGPAPLGGGAGGGGGGGGRPPPAGGPAAR